MIGDPYSIEIKSLSDATCDVVFAIEPPIKFVTEEARVAFGRNVLHIVCRRANDPDIIETGVVEVTHDTSEGQSMGYAKINALRYGSGKEIFVQALLTALNGSYHHLYENGTAPWDK